MTILRLSTLQLLYRLFIAAYFHYRNRRMQSAEYVANQRVPFSPLSLSTSLFSSFTVLTGLIGILLAEFFCDLNMIGTIYRKV